MRNKREIYASALPNRAILIYLYLWDRADKEGRSFPSLKRTAQDLSLSVSTVRRAVEDLVNSGYIKKEERVRENGGRSSNLYTIT